jgi:hypothetical protein
VVIATTVLVSAVTLAVFVQAVMGKALFPL